MRYWADRMYRILSNLLSFISTTSPTESLHSPHLRSIRQSKLVEFPANLYGPGRSSTPSTDELSQGAAGDASPSYAFPSLFTLAGQAVESGLSSPSTVCSALSVSELLLPTTRRIYSHCLACLSRTLLEAFRMDPSGFNDLSPAVMVELLQQNDIPVRCCSRMIRLFMRHDRSI